MLPGVRSSRKRSPSPHRAICPRCLSPRPRGLHPQVVAIPHPRPPTVQSTHRSPVRDTAFSRRANVRASPAAASSVATASVRPSEDLSAWPAVFIHGELARPCDSSSALSSSADLSRKSPHGLSHSSRPGVRSRGPNLSSAAVVLWVPSALFCWVRMVSNLMLLVY
jgi:hypothetical protein